jgi:3-phosphoshikimate 1-carboxyvinyltransferase
MPWPMTRGAAIIRRPEGRIRARIRPPSSKSVANRALLLAHLAGDPSCVERPGDAEDTRILRELLLQRPQRMHGGDGGTTFRFLLAWACVQPGEERMLTGNPRLLERPHGPLVRALRTLGADITERSDGLLVRGGRMRGGAVQLHSPESSQYISALLLIASCFSDGMVLHWTGTHLSRPYVDMTLRLCRRFGASIREEGDVIRVEPAPLKAARIVVPGDWSAAAFWYQVAALSPGSEIFLEGLQADGLQGDEAVAQLMDGFVQSTPMEDGLVLRQVPGANGPFTADLIRTPDLFQPLAFTLAALGQKAEFTGLHNLPLKETDRLQAVADALQALGCTVGRAAGSIQLQGPITRRNPAPFDPRGDHRMAMSLAPLALVCDAISVLDPEVVGKSYPGFWDDLQLAGFSIRRG